jgi:hypothetical protein
MVSTGFTNSFTAGEISSDAWDRTDIQPVAKGCALAQNGVVRVAGPIGKRRGFWDLGDAWDSHNKSRLIPFRKSVNDALMLEFSHLVCRVWNNDGAPLIGGGGAQVTFSSPYSEADLNGLRFKQVNDVIYLRNSAGLQPLTLTRLRNDLWQFSVNTFPNGPWRPENLDLTFTLTVTGTDDHDANPSTTAGSMPVGETVTLTASQDLFDPAMVGVQFRLRENTGSPSVQAWKPGYHPPAVNTYSVSAGRVYKNTTMAAHDETVTNPPVQDAGLQSDGGNTWLYLHDGAGIVQIVSVTDTLNAEALVMATLPFRADMPTPYWAEGAYSTFRGWPRMWPGLREERLVEGATASNLDFLDLTETAGFAQVPETFTPGLGTGQVLATDAVRRRVGVDGAELLWSAEAGYLIVASASGEYIVAGSVLDEPISPTSVLVKQISEYGSEDVYPARAHGGLIHVPLGGQTLRELSVDTNQQASGEDLTVLASDTAGRGFAQLAWIPQPDEVLWFRLNGPPKDPDGNPADPDGGLGAMTYHKEQQVRGFASVLLPGGFIVEDIATLPGPGRLETLWMTVTRVKDGQTQRRLWMQSQVSDGLFMDAAQLYAGAPAEVIGGLTQLEGELVRILADGIQQPDQLVADFQVTLAAPASRVLVGLPYVFKVRSLKLDQELGGSLNMRQRVVGCTVSMKTALAKAGAEINGVAGPTETISPRLPSDVPGMIAKRCIKNVSIAGDSDRDVRLVITDDTAYDAVLYSLKPTVAVGG